MDYVKIGGSITPNEKQLTEICEEFKISNKFAHILFSRGIDTKEKINNFLNCSIKQLSDPFLFANMQKVVERIKLAKENNESVVVFGDYDVDGISAAYILLTHFREMGINANAYIPHRIADGYGLTESAICEVKRKYNCSLIVSVDCGISCKAEIESARLKGIEVIVTDHHIVPENKPNALIINPKLKDGYPYENLCGAGVALKVVQAISGIDAVKKYLTITAIATVADIVPLTDENRAIVKLGLINAKKFLPIGLKKLCDISGIKKINTQSISYKLAPKINAPGRLGDSNIVLELFLEKDEKKAGDLAADIFKLNSKRQDIGASIYEDCLSQINELNITAHKCFVLKNENWEAGLLGIACAKIAGIYNRPTFLFSLHDGVLKGSVRSINGINIVKVLTHVKENLINFGGHEMAAGLSISPEKFDAFKKDVEDYINAMVFDNCYKNTMEYDIEISSSELNLGFAKELEKLEPTGCDNAPPVFKITFDKLSYCCSKNSREHLIVNAGKTRLLCFNGLKFVNTLECDVPKCALAELAVDEFNGAQNLKVTIKYIKPLGVAENQEVFNGICSYHTFNSYGNLGRICEFEKPEIKGFGSVYVSFNRQNAASFAQKNNLKLEMFSSQDYNSESLVLLAPLSENDVKNYHKIWFIDDVVPLEFAHKLACLTGTQVYVKKGYKNFIPAVDVGRDVFAQIFKIIKTSTNINAANILNFYNCAKFCSHKISFGQFAFCLCVFEELGFLQVSESNFSFKIKINKSVKKDLAFSKLYAKFV